MPTRKTILFILLTGFVVSMGYLCNFINRDGYKKVLLPRLSKSAYYEPPIVPYGAKNNNYEYTSEYCKNINISLLKQPGDTIKYPYVYIGKMVTIIPFVTIFEYGYVLKNQAGGGTVILFNVGFDSLIVKELGTWRAVDIQQKSSPEKR